MRISQINQAIKGISSVDNRSSEDIDIRYLLTDSRQLSDDAHSTLFFAIKTERNDGARYIDELYAKGVRAFIQVNATETLQTLAAYVRSLYEGQVIAITGSNGKTVVKEWLWQLLREDYDITRSPASYNSQIGVPLSVWQLINQIPESQGGFKKDDAPQHTSRQLGIFEAGISQPGEMERLEKIIRPTIGVVTYIGAEHGENFESMEQKRAEKMKLFSRCPIVVEDPSHQNARTCAGVMRVLGYSDEVITERILHQTHETVMGVNLTALISNVRYFRSCLDTDTRLTCMVKAYAYGSGSIEVSKALQASGMVDYLAVAVADEGVELRRAGIKLPVIVMDPEEAAMNLIIENNLEPNIYSFHVLETFRSVAAEKGLENYPIHIKIDSGMHRLGFYLEDMEKLGTSLQHQKVLKVQSIFSHFAGSDEACFDTFTRQQAEYFTRCADRLESLLDYKPMRHICNSAGIERFREYQFDMCRLGIGMYGFSFAGAPLRNVCSLKTTILSVKTVKKGETIGYGRHTTLKGDSQIAVIPIGYADGFDRRFSNGGGIVYVRGKRCPVVGNICMDQAMIDVTGTDAHEGDQAEIFGEHIPVQELSDKLGTITYEILTSISRRVQRVFYYE